MYKSPLLLTAGDQSLLVQLGDSIELKTNMKVHGLIRAIELQSMEGVLDLIPGYSSVLINYDPLIIGEQELKERVNSIARKVRGGDLSPKRTIQIPTLYGGEYGIDLPEVSRHAGISEEEVISLHSEVSYTVYMIGFSPGFPYLGGMSDRIACPRLSTPRIEIPAGSVGIAESQTGVYPMASPGGWQLIGRTPINMFNPDKTPPSVLAAGDLVKFVPLDSEQEFLELAEMVSNGQYKVSVEELS